MLQDYKDVKEILQQAYLGSSNGVINYEHLFVNRLMRDLSEYYPAQIEIDSYELELGTEFAEPDDSVDFVEFEPSSQQKRFFAVIGP